MNYLLNLINIIILNANFLIFPFIYDFNSTVTTKPKDLNTLIELLEVR